MRRAVRYERKDTSRYNSYNRRVCGRQPFRRTCPPGWSDSMSKARSRPEHQDMYLTLVPTEVPQAGRGNGTGPKVRVIMGSYKNFNLATRLIKLLKVPRNPRDSPMSFRPTISVRSCGQTRQYCVRVTQRALGLPSYV